MDQVIPGWLSVEELVHHRMESFHRERVRAIVAGEAPFRLKGEAMLVVHLIPLESVGCPKRYTAFELKLHGQAVRPLGEQYGRPRFNADGFAMHDGEGDVGAYTQLIRDGRLEAVTTHITYEQHGSKLLRLGWSETATIELVRQYLGFCQGIGINHPIWIFAALAGCQDARSSTWQGFSDVAISRPLVFLPKFAIESFDIEPVTHVRPLFDCLANAVGFEKSPGYDEQGNRREVRGW